MLTSSTPVNANSKQLSTRDPIRTREVGWPIIALFIGVASGLELLLLKLQRSGTLGSLLAGPDWKGNLFFYSALLLLAVGGVLFGIGRLRPADVGVERSKLAEGALVFGAIWLLDQAIGAIYGIVTTGPIVERSWATNGVEGTLLWAAVMFLGAALYEEIAFRGFLFPQLYLKFRGSDRVRLWAAVFVSQFLFAIGHVPAHLMIRHLSGRGLWTTVVVQGLIGVVLVLLYLRTRNLWITVGIHGLVNAPTPLLVGTVGSAPFLIALLIGWPWIVRRSQQRGLARVVTRGTIPA
jgi:membrane protease YdiL (CAAX protease family)